MQRQIITISKQSSLTFPSTVPMHAHDFRKAFSSWLAAHPVSLALVPELGLVFQRAANGERINDAASFRFDAQPHSQILHALGDIACEVLERVQTLCDGLSQSRPYFLGQPVLTRSDIALNCSKTAVYQSPKLIVCKNAQQYAHWSKCDQAQKDQRIEEVLIKGLEKQAQSLGYLKPIGFKISELQVLKEWVEPKLQEMQSKAYIRVVFARYKLNVGLIGSWAAGPLISKGYGLISAAK